MCPNWKFILERGFRGHWEAFSLGNRLEGYLGKNIPGTGSSSAEQSPRTSKRAGRPSMGELGERRSEDWALTPQEKGDPHPQAPWDLHVEKELKGGGQSAGRPAERLCNHQRKRVVAGPTVLAGGGLGNRSQPCSDGKAKSIC